MVVLAGCRHAPAKKMIVLGVDGMDPNFVEQHWKDLPNLALLRDQGRFSRLRTTTPPQSPVAWSTFSTGLSPDGHGIYDFVHRDPVTRAPFLSTDRTEWPRFALPFGPYELPLSRSRVVSLRHGRTFWQVLRDHHIPVTVIRIPANYPPVPSGNGLAGMGTPDLRGTLGTFTYYTDDPEETEHEVSGGSIRKVAVEGGQVTLMVDGPPNSLRRDRRPSRIPLVVDVDPDRPFARLVMDGQDSILREGEWSDWMSADFPLLPHLVSTRGMFRVWVKQLHPAFQVYVSPVNLDPSDPALPISHPKSLSRTIAGEIGPYGTLGIEQDTSAFRQGVFDLKDFLRQSRFVLQDESRLLDYALRHYDGGFLFFYFSSIDQNSHMLWGRYEPELLSFYHAIDNEVGKVRKAQPEAELIVMSDHGFTTFDRAVNLNTWLRDQGLPAYALGLNGLYLTRKSSLGTVRARLLSFRDPLNGRAVVETLEATHPSKENAAVAPDAIVGYARGYRASWRTALGEAGGSPLENNDDAWIADHCINALDVPGVFFSMPAMPMKDPGLEDLGGAILRWFGVKERVQ